MGLVVLLALVACTSVVLPTATTDPYAALRGAALNAVMQRYETEFREENRRLAATFDRSGDPERIGSVVGVTRTKSGAVRDLDVTVHYQIEGLQIARMSRVVVDSQTMQVDGPVTTFIGSEPTSDALSLKPIAEAQGPATGPYNTALVKLYGVELGHGFSDPANAGWGLLEVWAKVTNTGSKPIHLDAFSFVVVQESGDFGSELVPVVIGGARVGGLITSALTASEIERYGIGHLDRIGFEVFITLNPGYSLDLTASLPYDVDLTPGTYLLLAGARFPFPR